ncbi:hypothetical protein Golomagni_04789 [Golovinomyces magnicellulatus]|nr:hypothetical protein Golomagni_04789 [Golovinomyces magnicellulatus]
MAMSNSAKKPIPLASPRSSSVLSDQSSILRFDFSNFRKFRISLSACPFCLRQLFSIKISAIRI